MWSQRSGGRGVLGTLGVLTVAATAVVATSTTATGAPGVEVAQQATSTADEEYVVSFTGTPEAATAAIQAACGTIEGVTA